MPIAAIIAPSINTRARIRRGWAPSASRIPNSRVRQLTEKASTPGNSSGQGVEVVQGDLEDPGSLEWAAHGVYGIFSVQDYWVAGFRRKSDWILAHCQRRLKDIPGREPTATDTVRHAGFGRRSALDAGCRRRREHASVWHNGSGGQAYKKAKGAHWIAASVARFCPIIRTSLPINPAYFDRHTEKAELARLVIRRKGALVQDDDRCFAPGTSLRIPAGRARTLN
jgi:hypothetical protein